MTVRKGKNIKVLSVGEVLWDVFPNNRVWGGAPANFAFHASQLGAEAVVISAIGKDELGRELLDEVSKTGVRFMVNHVDAPTGCSLVKLDAEGQPVYEIVEPSAWDFIELNDQMKSVSNQVDLICFGTLGQRNAVSQKSIMEVIKNKKEEAKVMFDVNFRQNYYHQSMLEKSLRVTHFLKINEEELRIIESMLKLKLGEIMKQFGLEMVILTKGHKGSEVFTDKLRSSCPVKTCKVVDSVGAGDAFGAALVIQLLKGSSIEVAQEYATKIAAYVCEHAGATVLLPPELKKIHL